MSPLALVAAAVAGAALVLVGFGVMALSGIIGIRDAGVAELSSRLARLEAETAVRAEQPAALAKSVGDLGTRLAKVESTLATPRPAAADPAMSERLVALEATEKSLAGRAEELSRRIDATAKALDDITEAATTDKPQQPASAKADLDRLAERIAAMESATKVRDERADKSPPNVAADSAVRLAVLAEALKSTVERGGPFTTELAALKPIAADSKSLTPLEPFAATGVPTAAALSTELAALLPAMSRIAEVPTGSSGLLDRLQNGAGRLVRIRPLDEPRSDDPADVLTRVRNQGCACRHRRRPRRACETAGAGPRARCCLDRQGRGAGRRGCRRAAVRRRRA